jgi:FkbM family methyltransferase
VAALFQRADSYVSLHRAEGYGLTLAESMALGKPVIATAYSGTLEVTTPANAWLIPYRLVPVGDGSAPYPPHSPWAAPDVTSAAAAMRAIVDNPEEAKRRGERAARDIAHLHSPERRAAFVAERIAALDAERPAGVPSAPRLVRLAKRVERKLRSRVEPEAAGATDAPAFAPHDVELIGMNIGPMRVPRDEVIHPWVVHYLSWEDEIVELLRRAVPEGGTAVDIGAHVGLHTIPLSAFVGETGRVIAVEPSAATRAVLEENLHDRPYTRNVEVVGAAAWDRETAIELTPNPTNSGDTRAAALDTGSVRAVVLDDWFSDTDRLDVVKVDAQGNDHIALAGLAKTIARCRPLILVEFDPGQTEEAGYDPLAVAEGYAAYGLGVYVFETGDRDLPAAELVALARRTGNGFVTLLLGRS